MIIFFIILLFGTTFFFEKSISVPVYSQTIEKVKLEPFLSQYITIEDPASSDSVSVLEILANYTVVDKSLLGSAVNAKLTVFESDGGTTPIKVSNYPNGFFLNEEGFITFNSQIDEAADSVTANVFITDLEGITKLSNTIHLTETLNEDEDQESILRIEDGTLAVLSEDKNRNMDDG